ncbi:MAG: hypothetical protein QNJ68_07020 [Microcoleaceae cyanobacterium MO_207.B10]|nr:hypothetical protein [Microcoleaceae cyanobacterium MO_207.B10]
MLATNIINLGSRVCGFGCGEIIGKTKKKAGYKTDKVEKFY